MRSIYIYNSFTKEELFGTATDGFEDETRLNGIPDKKYDIYTFLDIKKRTRVGSFLCDIISMDFDNIMALLELGGIELLSQRTGLLANFFSDEDVIVEDINILYLLKEYIDFCNEYPLLYSIDYFNCFLDVVNSYNLLPETAPYSVHQDELKQDEIIIGVSIDFPPDNGESYVDLDTYDYRKNSAILRKNLLEFVPYSYNPDDTVLVYDVSDLVGAALISASTLIDEQFPIKKCGICGKYFVPLNRSDTLYCDRISPADPRRTCKEYGSQKLWYDRLKSDEVAKMARNIYCAKQMLVRRNPDIVGYRKMFEYFKTERKKWEALVKSGKKSKEEYTSWLNEMKAKKTL